MIVGKLNSHHGIRAQVIEVTPDNPHMLSGLDREIKDGWIVVVERQTKPGRPWVKERCDYYAGCESQAWEIAGTVIGSLIDGINL